MEVLSKGVPHEVWLLMELLAIEVLDTNTDFSAFLDVESESHEGHVWVNESHEM